MLPQVQLEEEYFANVNNNKGVECIVPTSEIVVNFRDNGMHTKKTCILYAEKMPFKGLIQLRLTERCDQRLMYMTTVDHGSFQTLKKDQSLHVTFGGFIENMVRILHDCQAGKLEIAMSKLYNGPQCLDEVAFEADNLERFQLQFIEVRPFKNLVHLSLPSHRAPLHVVLFYMSNILDTFQKNAASKEQTLQQYQHSIQMHLNRIEQVEGDNMKLRENMQENTRNLNQRHAEEMQQMQESLRMCTEQRHADNERTRKTISSLQTQLEKMSSEKATLQKEKSQELKRNETLIEELASVKGHVSNLKEQNEKLHADVASHKNAERKLEMLLSDARKQSGELQERVSKFDKVKADIVADLEAEKKISQVKRQALAMATEEISKANEIITKLTQTVAAHKKTIGWRTEVALLQEKAVEEKERTIKSRDEEIMEMRRTIDALRAEIQTQLQSMKGFANTLEQKYTNQINILKDKLNMGNKENFYPPRLHQKR